ncbi:MAG: hypothetical protein QE485_10600 [Acidovorax sp.]|uniref:hypothetical protein n=1 Tax=Acidovorax sp. TaxID=1872122 RepID=UPI00261CEBE4|nr:hypothetical protein [Acidovorax sp.]MDH4417664.1 hypothetical protein [Acidovorax sp.]
MDEATQQPAAPQAHTPINWYSGWRLVATAAATVLAANLFGIAGAAAALVMFFVLQPRRGNWQALGASIVTGIAVAAALSFSLLREQGGTTPQSQQAAPQSPSTATTSTQPDPKRSFTYEEAFPKK